MSTTRKAAAGSPLAQERYMSSVELAEKEGLKGMPVAAKASLYSDPRKRSLLFFLRTLSSRPGGLGKVASDLLEMFPDRIGCPIMHALGMKPGRICDSVQVRAIREELGLKWQSYPLRGECDNRGGIGDLLDAEPDATERQTAAKHPKSYSLSIFMDYCRKEAQQSLAEFLWEFCLNPKIELAVESELPKRSIDAEVEYIDVEISEFRGEASFGEWDPERKTLRYFRDITGALLEYKERHEQLARAAIAETNVSRATFRTLERGLRSRKIVVVDGIEGIGKSFSGEAWAECHLGESVFVRLEGIVTKTTFFQAISAALGLTCGVSQKSQEMQIRIQHHLKRSGCMLIIDEAHRLFQMTQRIFSHPELVNWVYTCWDQKIPVALLVTPQFVTRMDRVEDQTDWRSGQFKRRVELWTKLPQKLSEMELHAVALKIAPSYTQTMRDELVDFALPSRRQIDAMRRAMSAGEFIAEENGRNAPTHRDLLAGIEEAQATDQATTTPLDKKRQMNAPTGTRRGRPRITPTELLHDECSDAATEPAETLETEFTRAITPAVADRTKSAAGAPV
jgi:hypothetical protein